MRESVSRPGSHGHSHSHTAGSQVQEPLASPLWREELGAAAVEDSCGERGHLEDVRTCKWTGR